MQRSAKVFSPSGTISALSNSMFMPSPVQSGQAPKGLLNENSRGSIAGRLTPQSLQAKCSLNSSSSACSPSVATSTKPSASFSAVSTESVRRC